MVRNRRSMRIAHPLPLIDFINFQFKLMTSMQSFFHTLQSERMPIDANRPSDAHYGGLRNN